MPRDEPDQDSRHEVEPPQRGVRGAIETEEPAISLPAYEEDRGEEGVAVKVSLASAFSSSKTRSHSGIDGVAAAMRAKNKLREVKQTASNGLMSRLTKPRKYLRRKPKMDLEGTFINTEEVEHVDRFHKWVVYPDSRLKNYWDYCTLFALFYNVCYVPFFMAFIVYSKNQLGGLAGQKSVLDYVDYVSDTIFIVDLFVNFRIAYFEYEAAEKYIVDDSRKMALQYLKSWFIVDLLAVGIPYDFYKGKENNYVTSLSLFKMLRLVKIVSLLDKITSNLSMLVVNAIRMVKIIASFVLFAHLVACFWYYLGVSQKDVVLPKEPAGWLVEFFDVGQLESLSMWDMYTLSLYWAIVSICTTGYGDFYGTTTIERVFITIMLLAGAILYAFLFGNVTVLLQNLDMSQQRFTSRMEVSDEFCRIYSIPPSLAYRIRTHLEYTFDLTKGFQVEDAIEDLPWCLQSDIKSHMHAGVISDIPFFRKASPGFLRAIISKLKPIYVMDGEKIFEEGDLAREMFILRRGRVEVLAKDGHVLVTLEQGQFFGEIGLFAGGTRTAAAAALDVCHLYSLNRDDFDEVMGSFPEFKKIVNDAANVRLNRDDVRKRESTKTFFKVSTKVSTKDSTGEADPAEEKPAVRASLVQAGPVDINVLLANVYKNQEEFNGRLARLQTHLKKNYGDVLPKT